MSEIALPKIDSSILNRKSEIVKKLSKLTNIENVLSEADELRPYETDALSVYTQTPLAVVLPDNPVSAPLGTTLIFSLWQNFNISLTS